MQGDRLREIGLRLLDKYGLEKDHALHVERLAVRLFEGVCGVAGCKAECLGLLRFAALTHDIGHYVDERTHHIHSAYLITHDVLARELPEREREAAAWLALNHRKRSMLDPKRYAGKEGRAMARLAVLLRLADAFDYEHRQEAAIASVDADRESSAWTVRIGGFDPAAHEARIEKKLSFAKAAGWDIRVAAVDSESGPEK